MWCKTLVVMCLVFFVSARSLSKEDIGHGFALDNTEAERLKSGKFQGRAENDIGHEFKLDANEEASVIGHGLSLENVRV
ncbi:hypothetical protein ACHWQZ_G016898 [Mnemiopsis leidyi]